jgi:hypothetical protein
MLRKQGVIQGIIFSLGFLIIVFTLLIMFEGKLQSLATVLISLTFMGALSLLGWFILDRTY